MLTRWGGWIILVGLATITTFLVYSLEEDPVVNVANQNTIPDYTLKNFSSTRLNEQGQLKNQMTATTMKHYLEANTQLTAPSILFYKANRLTWTVQAEQGEVSPTGHQVWLLGHTTLQRQTKEPKKQVKIISQDVFVQLEQEYAETAAPTTIIKYNGQTEAVGMRVFLPTEQVELLSQVRGHYERP